ncbi:hypothetical protein [Microbacterium hominis]|uniref:Uncharacterized protein n=1 Tax=Microbacterium hominis TaxID=162426 RepID=A0A7D4U6K7_9MICO|nr:hypothetical protein [Microbacterium hominis]QKJ18466.1 hypothetical protein HQM25_03050 [Microbacterium hominis]
MTVDPERDADGAAETASDADEQTALSRRRVAARPADDDDAPFAEDTIVARRRVAAIATAPIATVAEPDADAHDVTEATVIGRRPPRPAPPADLDDTVIRPRTPARPDLAPGTAADIDDTALAARARPIRPRTASDDAVPAPPVREAHVPRPAEVIADDVVRPEPTVAMRAASPSPVSRAAAEHESVDRAFRVRERRRLLIVAIAALGIAAAAAVVVALLLI